LTTFNCIWLSAKITNGTNIGGAVFADALVDERQDASGVSRADIQDLADLWNKVVQRSAESSLNFLTWDTGALWQHASKGNIVGTPSLQRATKSSGMIKTLRSAHVLW
jgi:hypothetical protein